MKKELKSYMDEKGWIGHRDIDLTTGKYKLDFGDATQRMSMNYIFDWTVCKTSPMDQAAIKAGFYSKSRYIWLANGEPVRHWTRNEWYGKPGTMSADQIEPYMWASVIFDLPDVFWEMFFKLMKRGFFAWNTKKIGQQDDKTKIPDFIGLKLISPTLRMIMKRGPVTAWMLYIPLILWDLIWMGMNSIFLCLRGLVDREETSDDLNMVVSLIGSKECFDNPSAWYWRQFYKHCRPIARLPNNDYFNAQQRFYLGPVSAFNQYFYEVSAPPLDEKAQWVILWL